MFFPGLFRSELLAQRYTICKQKQNGTGEIGLQIKLAILQETCILGQN